MMIGGLVTSYNVSNERAKYKYRIHIRRALKKDDKSIIAALKYLRDYELFTSFEDFARFSDERADKYIKSLFDRNLSLSYITHSITALREFLYWLERQKGYRNKINYNHIDYLNISTNQRRTAKATEYKKSYPYEQILHTIRMMLEATTIQRRDKAIISLQALCGLRVSELRTVKIRNLITEDGNHFIHVNPKDMSVKFAKTRHAIFMPLPEDITKNVLQWKNYLTQSGFTGKDSLFPQIPSHFNQSNLLESGITHNEIRSNTTIRDIFAKAFTAAGYEYLRPHSFRHTIVRVAGKKTPEFLNAVRQSLGQSSIDTTCQSYGELSEHEQRTRISNEKLDFGE